MTVKNDLDWIKIFDKITDWKICLSICMTCGVLLCLIYTDKIQLSYFYKLIIFIIFVLSCFYCLIRFILFIINIINKHNSIDKCRLTRLQDIFTMLNCKNTYEYIKERRIITIAYNHRKRQFTANDIYSYLPNCNPMDIQNVLNDLCKNTHPLIDNKVILFKDGKYNFYNCIWKELKSYQKNNLFES